jgi:hypothetical protein
LKDLRKPYSGINGTHKIQATNQNASFSKKEVDDFVS